MRSIIIDGSFGLDNLKIIEGEKPSPGPGQVLLKMKAVSINYRDLMTVQGAYDPKQPLPLVPCSDGVGIVETVGEGVTRVRKGDRVCPIFCQSWIEGPPSRERLRSTLGGPLEGTLSEWMVVDEQGLVHPPKHLTHVECASLPCAAVTAWTALFTEGNLEPDMTVLLLGTGGVSVFALQFAKAHGVRVIITSSSNEKLQKARALGADEVVNYRETEQWWKTVRQMTGGKGVDRVVEVGGAGTLEQSIRSAAIGAHISVIGVLSGVKTPMMVIPILMSYLRLQGILVGNRVSFEFMNRFIGEHKIKPVIHAVFSFEDIRKAFDLMAAGGHFGKICISIEE